MITQDAGQDERTALSLGRREGEFILIGDNIVVQVSRIRGSDVRLRIVAPREVKILRGEIEPHEQDERTSGI